MQVTGGHRLRVVLLAGLPYSGKTHLALKLRELGWDHIQHHTESSVESLQSALRSSLEAGRDVVVDAKNLTKAERQQWLSVASQAIPKAADGSGGVSQFVVILAMNPTGPDAARLDPTHLKYRESYLSPHYTASLSPDQAVEYIHSVIVALDQTFEVPYTTEGIDSLAHVRTQPELEQVLGWLSHANQYGMSGKPGWGTPVPSSAMLAATQWSQAHGLGPPVTAVRAQPGVAVLPPAPTGMSGVGMGMGGASSTSSTNHMSQGHFVRQNDPSSMMTAMGMGAGAQGTHVNGMGGTGAFNYPALASPSASSFSSVPSQAPGATYSPIGAAPATYIPTMAMGQGPASQFSTNNGGFQNQAQMGGFNGGFMQSGVNSVWGGSSLQPVKQEFGEGMPSKRPYEHGPGATDGSWNPPDVKRQAGPSSSPHQSAPPQGVHPSMQGMPSMGAGGMRESRPMQHRDTNSEPQHKGPPQPMQVDLNDPRPIILFELSGVLCNSTKDRMNTRTRNHMPRPGIGHLARLMPYFRIGIYSTAIKKTVLAALAVVSSAIRGELASSPDGWKMLLGGAPSEAAMHQVKENGESLKCLEVPPEHKGLRRVALTPDDIRGSLAWGLVFDEHLVLHRDHTDMTIQENREITVKAVKTLFPNPDVLRRVLVVDEPHYNQQDENFIALKKWDQDNRADSQIPALVDSLLAHLPEANGDVRTITGKVGEDLKAAASIPVLRPVYKPVDSTEGYYETYPLRPGAEPCSFYLDTGHCRFGEGCHFHHPPENRVKLNKAGFPMHPDKPVCQPYVDSGFCDYGKSCMKHHPNLEVVPGATRPTPCFAPGSLKKFSNANFQVIDEDWTRQFPQRESEPVCTHFVQNGICRFGAKCKFHHPLDAATPLNNYGLPMRLNAPVCEYFCKTGACKFGVTCSKHHPHLTPGPSGGPPFDASMRSDRGNGGIRGGSGWGPVRGPDTAFDITDSMEGFFAEFASNPGKEICPNFKRTGHCKFGPSCMFDHPPEFMVKLNRLGLPLRPGAEMCKFYLTNGECGYGRQCMHHHPNIVPKGAGMLNNFGGYNALPPDQGWGGPPAIFGQPAFNGPPADAPFLGGQTMVIIPQQQFSQGHW